MNSSGTIVNLAFKHPIKAKHQMESQKKNDTLKVSPDAPESMD